MSSESVMIKQLLERKSVRVFEDREIDEEIVQDILSAAVNAPIGFFKRNDTLRKRVSKAI